MRRVAALLAAALLGAALLGCGGGGAEPGAPKGATLVLDFQPNAVHSGIYAAQANDYFKDAGLDLSIQEPSSTADSAKLLEAGRAQLAVMDINDFGIARERGLDLVAIAAIVQRPLASVIAGDRNEIRTPADLAGKTIGVTGVPSDDAVLDTVLRSGGVDPSSVHRVTIGFNAVADLAAGKVDAATGFWNAEGVELARGGIPAREFQVDDFGAPRYPELVVATTTKNCGEVPRFLAGLQRGYSFLSEHPDESLDELLAQARGLDRDSQEAQLDALIGSYAFTPGRASNPITSQLYGATGKRWLKWAFGHGLIDASSARQVARGFPTGRAVNCPIPL